VKPTFTHDCDVCRFLGSEHGHDLYFCPSPGGVEFGSVVARFGSEGRDYASMPVGVVRSCKVQVEGSPLQVLRRAVELAGVQS
jgi:hypothetical protein